MSQGRHLSPNLTNQPLRASTFSSAASSPLSAFPELKSIRILLWMRLCIKGMWWLVWSSIWTTQAFSIPGRRLFHFSLRVFTEAALLISFKNFSFAFIHNLLHPAYLFGLFDIPFSLSWIISIFWFRVRDVWLFLSAEPLADTAGLLTGLMSVLSYLREEGHPRGGREKSQNTLTPHSLHTEHTHNICGLGSVSNMGAEWEAPKQLQQQHQKSLSTKHHSKYNNDEFLLNTVRITKMGHRDTKWATVVGKMALGDLLDTGLPETFKL